jgi:hypothetical protein
MSCDVAAGPVTVTATSVKCGDTSIVPYPTVLTLTSGQATARNAVLITDARLTVNFQSLAIRAGAPFIACGSNVTIQLSGANSVTATGAAAVGIDCQRDAHLTFTGPGSLRAVGGIGTSPVN